MGIIYQATCKGCGHEWEQAEGGGFIFVQHLCGTCGQEQHRPRGGAPANVKPPMLRTQLRKHVTMTWGDKEPWIGTRDLTVEEEKRIEEMFGRCGCGGNFYPEGHKRARVRCPECRSCDVKRGKTETMFD